MPAAPSTLIVCRARLLASGRLTAEQLAAIRDEPLVLGLVEILAADPERAALVGDALVALARGQWAELAEIVARLLDADWRARHGKGERRGPASSRRSQTAPLGQRILACSGGDEGTGAEESTRRV
jgi:hypothetical protein